AGTTGTAWATGALAARTRARAALAAQRTLLCSAACFPAAILGLAVIVSIAETAFAGLACLNLVAHDGLGIEHDIFAFLQPVLDLDHLVVAQTDGYIALLRPFRRHHINLAFATHFRSANDGLNWDRQHLVERVACGDGHRSAHARLETLQVLVDGYPGDI